MLLDCSRCQGCLCFQKSNHVRFRHSTRPRSLTSPPWTTLEDIRNHWALIPRRIRSTINVFRASSAFSIRNRRLTANCTTLSSLLVRAMTEASVPDGLSFTSDPKVLMLSQISSIMSEGCHLSNKITDYFISSSDGIMFSTSIF
jgi:hypothetical protein